MLGVVNVWCWHPHLLLCLSLQHTLLFFLAESEWNFSEVIFASETANIIDLVVIRAEFLRISALNRIDKVMFACILLEAVS